jgi:hypothetical protein
LSGLRSLVPSVPEIAGLIARLIYPPPSQRAFILNWSIWRRQHQFRAAKLHYKQKYLQL